MIDVKTFNVPLNSVEIKEDISISTDTFNKSSKEKIIKKAIEFHLQGNISEAKIYYQLFIDKGFSDHRVFSNYGNLLKDLGNMKEAEILTRKAIEIKPDSAILYYNLATILREIGKLKEAEIFCRKAIEIKPELVNAYKTLATILRDIGKLNEAEILLLQAIQINPNLGDSHYRLGLILLQKGEIDLSLKCFSESAELLRGSNVKESHHRQFTTISKAKIDHDIEQFEYLSSQGDETNKFNNLAILYKKVASEINWPSETELITLNNQYQSLLKDSYNRLIHKVEAPRLKKGAINNSLNIEKITKDYFDHQLEVAYVDNLLSSQALQALREFLLGSTIWFEVKKGGYLGAYLKEGLANPLILQIAEELRAKFPKIFKDHPINQIWAYKYDSRAKNDSSSLSGIKVHADAAAINVNFWITPGEANLNPDSGGLVVYDVEAPLDWNFMTINSDDQKIKKELKKSKGNSKVIPHRENRAVIFNSNLFHETDQYNFKEGYKNRRINITMLFGDRQNR